MTNYTEQMESKIYNQWDEFDDYNEDYTSLIDTLNGENTFRSFGDGLLLFMQKKNPDLTSDTAVKLLYKLCLKCGVPVKNIASANTLKSWFKGGPRPKKGDDSRKSMFALAFAIELTTAETAELFHKVYLDRAFDYRNADEIIYYFCLQNQKSWADAERLISLSRGKNGDNNDHTVYTAQIKSDIDLIADESELISYISKHRHNFEKANISAKKNLQDLISNAKTIAKTESESAEYDDIFKGSDKNSLNFLYEMITALSVSGDKGTKTLFKNARLPKEIKNRFPESATLSKNEPTYEELRKLIILLFSYVYWYKIQKSDTTPMIDDYISEVNVYLTDSGLSPIYYGNPYDWLFLYCSLAERPLDTLRAILAEVLAEE